MQFNRLSQIKSVYIFHRLLLFLTGTLLSVKMLLLSDAQLSVRGEQHSHTLPFLKRQVVYLMQENQLTLQPSSVRLWAVMDHNQGQNRGVWVFSTQLSRNGKFPSQVHMHKQCRTLPVSPYITQEEHHEVMLHSLRA